MLFLANTNDVLLKAISFGVRKFYLHDRYIHRMDRVSVLTFFGEYDEEYASILESYGAIEISPRFFQKEIAVNPYHTIAISIELVKSLDNRRQLINLCSHLYFENLETEISMYNYLEALKEEHSDDEMFLAAYLKDKSLFSLFDDKIAYTIKRHAAIA